MKKAKHFEGGGGAEDQDERERARKASNFTDRAAAVQKLKPYSTGRGDDMEEASAPAPAPAPAPANIATAKCGPPGRPCVGPAPADSKLKPGLSAMGGFEPFEKFKARMDKEAKAEAARDVRKISGDLPQEWDRAAAHVPTKFSPKPGEEEMASVEAMRRPAPSKVAKAKAKAIAPKFRASMGYASGGSVSASRRGDGIAQRGHTRGKYI